VPQITCPCGREFHVKPSKVAQGGGKYCSSSCYGEYSEWLHRPKIGASNSGWKGDQVSYSGLHVWVRTQLGKPTACERCGTTEGKFEWASISHEYHRDLADWMALCLSCHRRYDFPTCRRGHEKTSENVWIDKLGKAHCRLCRNERLRMQRAGLRAEWDALAEGGAIRKKYGAPASA
jgi:hypothetical protein